MNRASSRSHCIFVISVFSLKYFLIFEIFEISDPASWSYFLFKVVTEELLEELVEKKEARLNLVDLAGSERVSQTGAVPGTDQFKEGCSINKVRFSGYYMFPYLFHSPFAESLEPLTCYSAVVRRASCCVVSRFTADTVPAWQSWRREPDFCRRYSASRCKVSALDSPVNENSMTACSKFALLNPWSRINS